VTQHPNGAAEPHPPPIPTRTAARTAHPPSRTHTRISRSTPAT